MYAFAYILIWLFYQNACINIFICKMYFVICKLNCIYHDFTGETASSFDTNTSERSTHPEWINDQHQEINNYSLKSQQAAQEPFLSKTWEGRLRFQCESHFLRCDIHEPCNALYKVVKKLFFFSSFLNFKTDIYVCSS